MPHTVRSARWGRAGKQSRSGGEAQTRTHRLQFIFINASAQGSGEPHPKPSWVGPSRHEGFERKL